MRLLILSPTLPVPPLDGTTTYLHNILGDLAQEAEITVAAHRGTPGAPALMRQYFGSGVESHVYGSEGLRRFRYRGYVSLSPKTLAVDEHFVAWVLELAAKRQYQGVLVCGSMLASFVEVFRPTLPAMYLPLDATARNLFALARFHAVPVRWIIRFLALKWIWYEKRIVKLAAASIFVSAHDKEYVVGRKGNESCHIVPNGVDKRVFHPMPAVPKEFDLVVGGNFEYGPNADGLCCFIDLMRQPALQSHAWRSLLCGRRCAPSIQRRLQQMSGITCSWDVPDMAAAVQRARLFVSPVRYGSGIRNNVIQALACGMPVISDPINVEALSGQEGKHYVCYRTKEEFAVMAQHLLNDPSAQERLGANGLEYVDTCHDWHLVARTILGLVHKSCRRVH